MAAVRVVAFSSDSATLAAELALHNDQAAAERIGLEDFADVSDELPDVTLVHG